MDERWTKVASLVFVVLKAKAQHRQWTCFVRAPESN